MNFFIINIFIIFTYRLIFINAAYNKQDKSMSNTTTLQYNHIYEYNLKKDEINEILPRLTLNGSPKDIFNLLAIVDKMKSDRKRVCISLETIGNNAVEIINSIPESRKAKFCLGMKVRNLVASHAFDLDIYTQSLLNKHAIADINEYYEAQKKLNADILSMCIGRMTVS